MATVFVKNFDKYIIGFIPSWACEALPSQVFQVVAQRELADKDLAQTT